jgi:hypothetical protein
VAKILLVDDEPAVAETLRRMLEDVTKPIAPTVLLAALHRWAPASAAARPLHFSRVNGGDL